MVCLADPAVRERARRDIKDMLDKRLTYRKEVVLENEIPPIPNVRRTRLELAKSPVYKRTKSMIPMRINKILVDKSRRVLLNEDNQSGSPDASRSFNVSAGFVDSDYDFGYYSRTKRRQSTTISDLTEQLKETRRLLDVLKESERNFPSPEQVTHKSVRRKIDMDHHEPNLRRPQPNIADFVSARELDCVSIESESAEPPSPGPPRHDPRASKEPVQSKFDVKSSYQDHVTYHDHDNVNEEDDEESDLKEFEDTGKAISKRNLSGGSIITQSDPFTDSDYIELGVINLQDELDLSLGYESDRYSMCSEKISHIEARTMLSESEQRFSAILNSIELDKEEDSFLTNERRMKQQISQLDDIISEPSSVEDLRFDGEELPLLELSTDTDSTVTENEGAKVMLPSRQDLRYRPSLKFALQGKREEGHLIQPKPLKPSTKPVKTKENIDFNNYEKDLGEIENLLFKYDEYRMEHEIKKSDKNYDLSNEEAIKTIVAVPEHDKTNSIQKPVRKIADGIMPKTSVIKAGSSTATAKSGTTRKDIKTGIAKGVPLNKTIRKPLTVSKPPSTTTKPIINKPSPTKKAVERETNTFVQKSASKPLGVAIKKPKNDVQSKIPTIPKVSPKLVKKGLKEETATSKTSTALAKPTTPFKSASPSKLAAKESANKTSTAVVSSPKVAEKPRSLSTLKNGPLQTKPTSSITVGAKTSTNHKDVATRKKEEVGSNSLSPVKVKSSGVSPTKENSPLSKLSPPKTRILTPRSLKTGASKGNYVQSAKLATIKSPGAKAPKYEPTTATKIHKKVDTVECTANETNVAPKGTTPTSLMSSPAKITSSLKISPAKPSPPSKTKSSPQKSQGAKESPPIKTSQQGINTTPTRIPLVKSPISKLLPAAKPLSATKVSPATKTSLVAKASSVAKLSSVVKPSLAPKPSLTAKSSPKRSASTEVTSSIKASPVKTLSKPLSNLKGESNIQKSSTNKTTVKPTTISPVTKRVITKKDDKTPQTDGVIKGTSSNSSSVPSSKVPTVKSGISSTTISPAKTTPKSSFTSKITSTGTKASSNKPTRLQPQTEKDLSTGKTQINLTSKLSPPKTGAAMKPVRSPSSETTTSTSPTSNNNRKIDTSPKAYLGLKKPLSVAKAPEDTITEQAKSSTEKKTTPTMMSLNSEKTSTKTTKGEKNPSSKTITPAVKSRTVSRPKTTSAVIAAKHPASRKPKVVSTITKPDVISKPKVLSKSDVSPKPKVLSKTIPVRGLQKPKLLK